MPHKSDECQTAAGESMMGDKRMSLMCEQPVNHWVFTE